MQNGYFRLVSDSAGYALVIHKPQDGGERVRIGELLGYLDGLGIVYDRKRIEMILIENQDAKYALGMESCPVVPETYNLKVSEDGMVAIARFFPPSQTGRRLSLEDFLKDLKFKNVSFGIRMDNLERHFKSQGIFCTDMIVAQGKEAVPGVDAKIEYMFDTELHRKPAMMEDGSVDYFKMTTINQCKKGDVLARIIPEIPGVEGSDVYGKAIAPRVAKPAVLKFGRKIDLSEDKKVLTAAMDGHVALVDDKVFLSDVYEVENVDVSTGNIEFEGSVQVNGDVKENFQVKAGGNVIINGLVEGANITAGGNIIIAKGMNGMSKGLLKAGGDIVVRFLENTRAIAGGYIHAEAILHSKISSGSHVTVEGKKGLIVGGYVQASNSITAKCIGANLGSTTVLEVGVNPFVKVQYTHVQKSIGDAAKVIKDSQVILDNFKDKIKKGVQYNEAQLKYMKSVAVLVQEKNLEMEQLKLRAESLLQAMEMQKQAEVIVQDEVRVGTTIIIGDASKTIQNSYHYCRFVREEGEVRMAPL